MEKTFYDSVYFIGINAILTLFDMVTAPFLLHYDVDVYKNLYLLWTIFQIPFVIFNIVVVYKTKNRQLHMETYLILAQAIATLLLIYTFF